MSQIFHIFVTFNWLNGISQHNKVAKLLIDKKEDLNKIYGFYSQINNVYVYRENISILKDVSINLR